jgi:hypothetical protein
MSIIHFQNILFDNNNKLKIINLHPGSNISKKVNGVFNKYHLIPT